MKYFQRGLTANINRQDAKSAKKGEKNITDFGKQKSTKHFMVLNTRFSVLEEIKDLLGGLCVLAVKKGLGV